MKLFQLECPNCGSNLKLKTPTHAVCDSCGSSFIIEQTNRAPIIVSQTNVTVNDNPAKKILSIAAVFACMVFLIIIISAVSAGSGKSAKTELPSLYKNPLANIGTKSASPAPEKPVSELFITFTEKAFGKNIADITAEELSSLKYMSISFSKDAYEFKYSFEDCDSDKFDASVITMSINRNLKYSSTDIGCFTGLVKLENYNITMKKGDALNLTALRNLGIRSEFSTLADIFPVSSITELTLKYSKNPTLEGIDKFTSLKTLAFDHSDTTNISLLSTCGTLTSLNFIKCDDITDFSVLYTLGNLKELEIEAENLRDIGFISQLASLETFALRDTDVLDISPLAGNTVIKNLAIEENSKITDYSAINTMPQLEALSFSRYFSQPMPALDNLHNVKKLSLSRAEDMSIVRNFPECTELTLSACNFTAPDALSSLKKLTKLTLSSIFNDLNNLNFLSGMNSLKYLDISGCSVYNNISGVFALPSLEVLNMNGCELRIDDTAVPDQTALRELYLSKVKIYKNVSVSQHGMFTDVSYDEDLLENRIDLLSHFPNLRVLNVSSNKLKSIDFVEHLPMLETLTVSDNYVTDLRPLERLSYIREVNAVKNSIVHNANLKESVVVNLQ